MARILIADDEPDILSMTRTIVASAGHETLTAPDGTRALELAIAEAPDLAVLDLRMPGIDGLEVARRIRAHPTIASMPIIMLTAWVQREHREAGAALVGAYLGKPFSAASLTEAIAELLEGVPS